MQPLDNLRRVEFSDFASEFRKSMDSEKPHDPELAAKWEGRLGSQYDGMVHSEAFQDFRNNIISLRERFVESLISGEVDGEINGIRKSINLLDTILLMPSVRIEQGAQAREALEGEVDDG